jgi:RimJ/RimL family protein N-acetyltransferase
MVKKLIGSLVSLSPIGPECADKWFEWLNDLDVALPLGDEAWQAITLENQKRAVESIEGGGNVVFSIVENASEALVGRCILFGINRVDGRGTVGIFLGDKTSWGKGYGEEAMRLLLDYAFLIQNLHSVNLGVFAFNTRARKSYARIGFKETGRRREIRKIAGRYHDAVLMDILENEYTPAFLHRQIERIVS